MLQSLENHLAVQGQKKAMTVTCRRVRRMTECVSIHTTDPLAEQLDALKELFFWHYEAGLYDLAEEIASRYRVLYQLYRRTESAQTVSDVQQTCMSAKTEDCLGLPKPELDQ
jgi:hypothetical protein